MKLSTLFGIAIGIIAIFGAFLWEGGSIDAIIMLPALTIVLGGTLAAGLAGSSFRQMAKLPQLFYIAMNPKEYDLKEIVQQIVSFSYIARRDGILALETQLDKVKHPHLKKLFEICIDGTDPETFQDIVDNEAEHLTKRHESNISLFTKLGGYSPTMGLIGTVLALIATFASAGADPEVLIRNIAPAFIATMWGILLANIVWLPVSDKLRSLHDEEIRHLQIMASGVYAVLLGDTPVMIKQRLASAFSLPEQEEIKKSKIRPFLSKKEKPKGNGPQRLPKVTPPKRASRKEQEEAPKKPQSIKSK